MLGLNSEIEKAFENGAPVAWGARGIWNGGEYVSLMWDRADFEVPDGLDEAEAEDRKLKFAALLNDGRLDAAFKAIPDYLRGSDHELVVLLDDDEVVIVANPNASYGYLCLAAWLKKEN